MKTPKPFAMKRLLPFLLFFISLSVAGQYNNEWIRSTQTYFKFKILNKGLYRIPKTALDAAGIGSAGAEFFELWRNGKQVGLSINRNKISDPAFKLDPALLLHKRYILIQKGKKHHYLLRAV